MTAARRTHPDVVDVQVVVLLGPQDPLDHVGGRDVGEVVGPVVAVANPAGEGPGQRCSATTRRPGGVNTVISKKQRFNPAVLNWWSLRTTSSFIIIIIIIQSPHTHTQFQKKAK